MNLKALATLAATVVATSAFAQGQAQQSCGAQSSCGKKEQVASCSITDCP